MKKITVEEIREQYPDPINSTVYFSGITKGYCVGGALCLALGYRNQKFPFWPYLGRKLQEANPRISLLRSWWYALRIIHHNEKERFEKAWTLLDTALRWGQ